MIEYWKDCRTGETHPWSSDDKHMEDWMRNHPPMYSWRVDLSKGRYITLTEYNPDGKGVIPHICDIKGIGMHSTDGSASYEIHCDSPRKVCDRLMCLDSDLRRDEHYALVHRRTGLGMTDELVQYCLVNHAPTNYGQYAEAFDYVTGFPSHWGYGAHGEVRFSEIEYPNGESWDTYQNERGYTKDDPNVEERIRWCNRINISINLSLDAKTTPTSVLAKALRFTDDPRVKAIVEGIFTEDDDHEGAGDGDPVQE